MLLLRTLLICLGQCATAQTINFGSLVSAGESLYNSVVATNGDNLGALATAAQSALSGVEASASLTQSASHTASSAADPTTSPTSLRPSSEVRSSLSSALSGIISTSSPAASQTSSSSSSSSTSSPTFSPSAAQAGAVPSTTSETDDDQDAQHRKDTLLEIILPTVLSGLTLLVLLALALWYCTRQRRRRRHRESGLQRLYAAGSTRPNSLGEMEERADYGLLENQHPTTPRVGHGEHTAYEPHNSIPMPAQSMLRPSPRQSPPQNTNRWTVPPSHFSTSTSTNGASVVGTSNSGGGSNADPRMSRETRKSYQPVVSEEMPAELETPVENPNEKGGTHTASNVARAHTPPLQAVFPWFGGEPSVPRRSSKRQSEGTRFHYPTREEAGRFSFGFPQHRYAHNTARGATQQERFSIPRKPISAQQVNSLP